MAKDPQDDDDLKLCSHTMMLPTRGQLEGRMIVTAYEHGLDNVTEEAVSAVVYAVEVSLLVTETILQVGCNELVCVLKVGTAKKRTKMSPSQSCHLEIVFFGGGKHPMVQAVAFSYQPKLFRKVN